MKKILLIILISYNGFCADIQTSFSKKELSQGSALLYADTIHYDDDRKTIEATGHVEIHRNSLTLKSDYLAYNQITQNIIATGHVSLEDEAGNISFFNTVRLSQDFAHIFVDHIRMILSDDAKLTGSHVVRAGDTSTFDKVTYSPCLVCRTQPHATPLWQIKANRVQWNETTETINYTDAVMEMKGVPVMYLPYFSHPAPNVKRKSGFLAPSLGGGGDLGAVVAIPYFWAIDASKDLTLTPLMAGSRPMLGMNYRQRFNKGFLTIAGSGLYDTRAPKINKDKSAHFRGHIKADARFNLNDTWRMGFNGERTTDQTYLRKFNYLEKPSSQSLLMTRGYMEKFDKENYTSLEMFDFQGLREQDINAEIPFILPLVETYIRTKPGWNNSYMTWDNHFSVLHRRVGADVTKGSTTGAWIWPKLFSGGQKATTALKLRGDVYGFSDVTTAQHPSPPQNGTKARLMPSVSTTGEWPFMTHQYNTRIVLEPLVNLTASPMERYDAFPNEDSRTIELNDLNLLSQSRFAGLDHVDGGSRVSYGFNMGAYHERYGNGALFLGQGYSVQKPSPFLEGTGFEKQLSDYVVRLKLDHQDWIKATSRALMDRRTFAFHRQEFSTELGKPIARLSLSYVHLPKIKFDPHDQETKQITTRFSSHINDNWQADIHTTRDLSHRKGTLSHGVGAAYQDECFLLRLTLDRKYFKDRDISPGVTFMFRMVFKNLGDVQKSSSI